MSIDIVRGELDRLFSLDELMALSSDLLGFEATEIGGSRSKASFARALTERCSELDIMDVLVEAVLASRKDVDARVRELAGKELVRFEERRSGDVFGPFTIVRKLAEGPRAFIYAAQKGDVDRTLKIFRRTATRNPRAVRRFILQNRLAARVVHESLPTDLDVGLADGSLYVAHAPVDGQPLSARLTRTGALHLNEARGLLRGVLAALGALHDKQIAHGAIRVENIFVSRGEGGVPRAVLVDLGGDRLFSFSSPATSASLLKTTSPEVCRGWPADPASDLYSLGAVVFEILSNKPLYVAETAMDAAIAHLTLPPPVVSAAAPRGWVGREIDDLVARLLAKSPSGRPQSVRAVIELLDPSFKDRGAEARGTIADAELEIRINTLVAHPSDGPAALALESTLDLGADPSRIAEAFRMAADQVESGTDAVSRIKEQELKKALLFRAARIFEANAQAPERAENVYAAILEIDPEDDVAQTALEGLRKSLGKHEELIEMLLEKSERAAAATERARALNQIGDLYFRELADHEQAAFAFARALSQEATNDGYAMDLERAAGADTRLWSEALQELTEAAMAPNLAAEAKVALYTRLGRWYSEKISRPDLGVPCFQAVLSVDPAHDPALAGLAQVYRRAQQWNELGQILTARADRAPTPAAARDIRAEVAELLDSKLNESGHARDMFEAIISEDPGHQGATDGLARIYSRQEDYEGLAKILERRAEALGGDARIEAICKVGELYEEHLDKLAEASRRYEMALSFDGRNLTALKGLERIFTRMGRYKELLENLTRQIDICATPRQRIKVFERIAGIEDQEFLNHERAAEALEAVLQIDPGHEGALSGLVRHYRSLNRWEDAVALYERNLALVIDDKRRIEICLAMGRVLLEQIGSPERARRAYEKVLEIEPGHGGALESLASVRAATGDAMAALSAVEALAESATTPENKADLWVRAAKILEDKGDRDGAIDRYKRALDAQPKNVGAWTSLRGAYLARGDAQSAIELMARTIEQAEGKLAKSRLYGEIAQLYREKIKDPMRARAAATSSIDLDPTSMLGLLVTGDLAFDEGHFLEAAKSYESLATRVEALPKDLGVNLLVRYVDALAKSGSTEKAFGTIQMLLALAPDDPAALGRAARVNLDAGRAVEAAALYEDLVRRFGDDLEAAELGGIMVRFGEAKLKAGDFDGAIPPLNEAADLVPGSPEPLTLLAKVFEAKQDFEEVVRLKTRHLDVVTGDDRSTLLLEIGDVLATQIGDRTRAARSYVAALDERPDDRRILTKLMQLYSEEKDWSKLVDVVIKLASKVDDPLQKAKYMHTAAIVTARQLGDLEQAVAYFDQVIKLDPTIEKALNEAIDICSQRGDYEGVERLLKGDLERASARNDTPRMLQDFDRLGVLYRDRLGWIGEAIDAFEAGQTLDPDNDARNDALAKLYASDPAQYLDKAVAAQVPILRRNPYRPDAYKLLRKLYTEAKRADAAWCVCQALFAMNIAEPDEERFFKRMRADGPAAAQDALGNDDWGLRVMHLDADPLLTQVFAIIQAAVFRKNGQPLQAMGYDPSYAINLGEHPYPMSQTLNYAAGVLGVEPPPTFQNPNDPNGVMFLHAHVPAILLGAAALATELPGQAAAFIAARHLAYYRPGLYVRHLVPTGTGLRAWLFAAIKLISPAFPVATELEGPVKENLAVLQPVVVGPLRDMLASEVTKLLQSGAIDLKKWVAAVDLSADRAGFIVANDLDLANSMIRSADDASSAVQQKDRLKELGLYAVSEEYFAVREKLGINIDA